VPYQPIAHHLLIEFGRALVAEEHGQAFADQSAQDVRRTVDRPVVDDDEAVEHREVVANECLDDVRFVADLGRAEETHGQRARARQAVAMRYTSSASDR
jgi:hypothetical protein